LFSLRIIASLFLCDIIDCNTGTNIKKYQVELFAHKAPPLSLSFHLFTVKTVGLFLTQPLGYTHIGTLCWVIFQKCWVIFNIVGNEICISRCGLF